MTRRLERWLAHCCIAVLLCDCASTPSPAERVSIAVRLASSQTWQAQTLRAEPFTLQTFGPAHILAADQLTVYIEGDGLAWLSPERLSDDPTPLEPVALKLALAQPVGNRVYLARPCQYVDQAAQCASRYWNQERFSATVIDAMNSAVSQLKTRFAASHLTLVGYSGGGAIAALIAARRLDVTRLVTVAGNLSVRQWTETQRLSALKGSLDPNDERGQLEGLEQWHFVGTKDAVVPMKLTEAFASGLPLAHVVVLDGFDHRCCWSERWPSLWNSISH